MTVWNRVVASLMVALANRTVSESHRWRIEGIALAKFWKASGSGLLAILRWSSESTSRTVLSNSSDICLGVTADPDVTAAFDVIGQVSGGEMFTANFKTRNFDAGES